MWAGPGQVKTPLMVTSYDTISRTPVIFKSFKPEHRDLPLWEICRASSAAPTYFPAHGMTVEGRRCALIDGGVVANNPTACAIAEAMRKDAKVDAPADLDGATRIRSHNSGDHLQECRLA